MRHRVEGRKLNRTASHRRALLRSLATSLIRHKRIRTTEAKAKELRRYAEAIITRAKRAYLSEQAGSPTDVHARRVVARDINDQTVVHELFHEVAARVAERPGGYTRVVKLGRRIGDGARIAVIELVDYNMDRDESAARSRSKKVMSRSERVRRSQEKQAKPAVPVEKKEETAPIAAPVEDAVVETPVVDEAPVIEAETTEPEAGVVEEPSPEQEEGGGSESADEEEKSE